MGPKLAAALLLTLLGACSRCGKQAPHRARDPARFLPRSADAILVVHQVGQLGTKLRLLEQLKLPSLIAQLQGFGTAQEYLTALLSQALVDWRSKEELIRAGIDPDRGLGVALLPSGFVYAVVPIGDPEKFEETLASWARNRLGANARIRSGDRQQRALAFSRSTDTAPVLGAIARQGFALVAPGDSPSQLAALASLAEAESFAADTGLGAALARFTSSRDLYLHLRAGSRPSRDLGIGECTLAAELAQDALRVRADLPRSGHQASLSLEKKGAPLLLGALPANAFAVGRFSGDPLQLEGIWPRLVGPYVTRAVEQSRFDINGELLSNLAPGAVASLSLAPTIALSAIPELDVRKASPFRLLHLVLVAPVKDAAKAEQTLRKVPAVAALFGARIQATQRQGRAIYLTSYAQGEGAHFALVGEKVVVAAPLQQLDETLAQAGREPAANAGPLADPELRQVLDRRAVAAVLDFPQLVRSVKELPSSAWGIGGFAIKATTLRWLEALDDLRAITFGAWTEQGAVQAEVELRFVRQGGRP